jgi:hypothetical protein
VGTFGSGGEPLDIPGQNPNGSADATEGSGSGKSAANSGQLTAEQSQPSDRTGAASYPAAQEAAAPSGASSPTVSGLFQLTTFTTANAQLAGSPANGDQSSSAGGRAKKLARSGKVPDIDDIDAIADPTERKAAQKLQQAVQRIKANRDRRANPVHGGPGSAESDTRRDW